MERKLAYPVPEGYLEKVADKWRDETLFGVVGWYVQKQILKDFEGRAVPFGGYLILSEDGNFVGSLTDLLGSAEISGNLKGKALTIVKRYTSPTYYAAKSDIVYVLTKAGESFKGHFEFIAEASSDYGGEASCILFPFIRDAFGIAYRPLPKRR